MKKILIFILIVTSVNAQKCNNELAIIKMEKKLFIAENYLNHKYSNVGLLEDFIYNMEEIAGIESDAPGTTFGRNGISYRDYFRWKIWLNKNYSNLCWDKVTKKFYLKNIEDTLIKQCKLNIGNQDFNFSKPVLLEQGKLDSIKFYKLTSSKEYGIDGREENYLFFQSKDPNSFLDITIQNGLFNLEEGSVIIYNQSSVSPIFPNNWRENLFYFDEYGRKLIREKGNRKIYEYKLYKVDYQLYEVETSEFNISNTNSENFCFDSKKNPKVKIMILYEIKEK